MWIEICKVYIMQSRIWSRPVRALWIEMDYLDSRKEKAKSRPVRAL